MEIDYKSIIIKLSENKINSLCEVTVDGIQIWSGHLANEN